MKKIKTLNELEERKKVLQSMLDSCTISLGSFQELTNEAIREYNLNKLEGDKRGETD